MATMNSYHSSATEDFGMRKWIFRALLVSIALHVVLFVFFTVKKLERFNTGSGTRLVPRAFTMKRVSIRPDLADSDEDRNPAPKKAPTIPKVNVPEDRPSVDTSIKTLEKLTPAATQPPKTVLNDKPQVATTSNLNKLASVHANAALQHDLDAIHDQLIKDTPKVAETADLKLPDTSKAGTGTDTTEAHAGGMPGFSDLDELLSQAGPLSGDVKPVNMPGGALFAFDRADLLPEAIETLKKLGALIQRNPRATFSIEGHTDNFGTPEYNMKLSVERAEAVRNWLIENMHIDPSAIEAKGFGSEHLIVPGGTREQQAINRRVEIVIRTPKD